MAFTLEELLEGVRASRKHFLKMTRYGNAPLDTQVTLFGGRPKLNRAVPYLSSTMLHGCKGPRLHGEAG